MSHPTHISLFLKNTIIFIFIFSLSAILQSYIFFHHFNPAFLVVPSLLAIVLAVAITKIHILKNSVLALNDTLETRVEEKTKEIKKLNRSLQKSVLLEVEKNRIKDQKLMEQSRLAQMGEMLSMIAHQWRQPLSAISTSAAHMQLRTELEDDLQAKALCDDINSIAKATQHLSNTIEDFKKFYQPTHSRQPAHISTLIEQSLSVLQGELLHHDIRPKIIYDVESIATIYHNELMQVLINLIKNSIQEHQIKQTANPTITIKAGESKKRYTIAIEDNAGGIPEDSLPKIFDPYYTTKESKNESGLGLYMARMIIDKHFHGTLQAKNIPNGANFTLSFPK